MLENTSKSGFRLNMKTSALRALKLPNNGLGDILDKFRDYLNVIEGFISFFRMA